QSLCTLNSYNLSQSFNQTAINLRFMKHVAPFNDGSPVTFLSKLLLRRFSFYSVCSAFFPEIIPWNQRKTIKKNDRK
ncbi:hypothetical protein, partial [Enterococcus italicus]|uniref:hypothetical protein n=1 Tax=Enterococcus italicus TaxID=246144 RepID=UPI003F4729E3